MFMVLESQSLLFKYDNIETKGGVPWHKVLLKAGQSRKNKYALRYLHCF